MHSRFGRAGLLWILPTALALSCDGVEDRPREPARVAASASPETDRSSQRKIVAFGDSLTAGFGIGFDEAYPAVLQELLDGEGYSYEVVNAGSSGETSAGGLRRLDWVLEGRDVAAIIVALGGNDGLRGLAPSDMKENLSAIIEKAKASDIRVLLAGFEAPPGTRDRYIREFVAVYPELAREHEVALMPFLLRDVAGDPELNQPDGKHPNARGARIVAENVWKHLKPLLPPPPESTTAP